MGVADVLSTRFRYDVIRGSMFYSTSYFVPKSLWGQSLNIEYSKFILSEWVIHRDCKNLLKESSVNSLSEGISCYFSSPHRHFVSGCSVAWRDLSPAVDIEIEKVLNNHCSKTMINECRPSLKSSLFTTLTYGVHALLFSCVDSREQLLIPTSGSLARLQLVCV